MPYFLAPFIAWVVSGVVKFIINYIRFGSEAKNRIGNGGFPSTHTTVMTTPTILIGLNEGFMSPLFGLAVAVTFIVIIDATGIRRAVGKQAEVINYLTSISSNLSSAKLRESMGHTKIEVLGGIILGTSLGISLHKIMLFLNE